MHWKKLLLCSNKASDIALDTKDITMKMIPLVSKTAINLVEESRENQGVAIYQWFSES